MEKSFFYYKSGIKVKISMRKFLILIYGGNCVSQLQMLINSYPIP